MLCVPVAQPQHAEGDGAEAERGGHEQRDQAERQADVAGDGPLRPRSVDDPDV
jgi:hypothetical protein